MSQEKEAEQAADLDQEVRTDTRTWLLEDRGNSKSLDYMGELRARIGMQERYADLDPCGTGISNSAAADRPQLPGRQIAAASVAAIFLCPPNRGRASRRQVARPVERDRRPRFGDGR